MTRSYRPEPLRLTLAGAAAGAVVVAAAMALTLPLVRGEAAAQLTNALWIASTFVATVGCAFAACRSAGRLRVSWTLIGVGAGLWAAGCAAYFYYRFLAAEWPFPTVGDAFLLAGALFVAAGLVAFPGATQLARSRPRALLDALVVVAALLFVWWGLVFEPLVRSGGQDVLAQTVIIAYPTVGFAVAVVALLTLAHVRPGNRMPLALVAAGLLVYAVTNAAFAYGSLAGTFEFGGVFDLSWVAAFLLVGLAALAPGATVESHRPGDERGALFASFLPYVALGTMIVLDVTVNVVGDRDPVVVGSAVVAIVAFGVRQVVTVRDNVALRQDLEGRVEERTAELAEANERNASILNAAADGIYGVDREGCLIFCNPAAAAMLGYEPGELSGHACDDLFQATTSDETPLPLAEREAFRAMAERATVEGTDERYTRRDGSTFPVRYAARPIEHDAKLVGAVVVFRDITEEQRLDRMKDEFVSVVSHELRTPLTSIRGSLGLLASGGMGELSEKGQRMVDIAVFNTDRLVRLLNDILDLERMESGRSSLSLQHCRMAEVVAESVAVMQSMADEQGVALRVEQAEGELLADPDRLTQLLTNLISNAVKFSPEKGTVRLAAVQDDGALRGSVHDEGGGIPPEQRERVFGRFQQVDSSNSRQKSGTGLGLAICRSIVERHGGTIWAESEPGAGTTIRFSLPAQSTGSSPEGSSVGAPTVVVCDDDPSVVEVLAHQLEAGGYRALRTRSADDALARARAEPPAALVLDLLMPDKDGWQALDELRADPVTRRIPVVVCSVLSPEEGESSADVAAWLTKPSHHGGLLSAVQQVVATGEAEGAGR